MPIALTVTCGEPAGPGGPVATVQILPAADTLLAGESKQLSAVLKDSTGHLLFGRSIAWSTLDTVVARVSGGGLLTGRAAGATAVVAEAEGKADTAQVSVVVFALGGAWDWVESLSDASGVVCIDTGTYLFKVNGTSVSGGSAQFGVCTQGGQHFANNSSIPLTSGSISGRTVTFGVGGCTYTGTVIGVGDSISGTGNCPEQSGSSTGPWHAHRGSPVASFVVSPPSAHTYAGGSVALTALMTDSLGRPLFLRPVQWSSDAPGIANPDTTGFVTTTDTGVANITASVQDTITGTKFAVVPINVRALAFSAVSLGYLHTCATGADSVPYCWGDEAAGQLGTSAAASICADKFNVGFTVPCSAVPLSVVDTTPAHGIATGTLHSCALTGTAAYCWGDNVVNQLGTPSSELCGADPCATTAHAVSGGVAFDTIAGGWQHTCGIASGGAAYCWGSDSTGQLGDSGASFPAASGPVAVRGGLTFIAIAPGFDHTCGIAAGGAAYCWGGNAVGQLGDSSHTLSAVPMAVAGGHTYDAITSGVGFSCAHTAGNAVYCWGYNASGELGDNATLSSTVPQLVSGGLSLTSVSAGYFYACGVVTGGAAYCWGDNSDGELGTGDSLRDSVPRAVTGGHTFSAVQTGYFHTCALSTGGALYCWGDNTNGQLGDGTVQARVAPTKVVGESGALTVALKRAATRRSRGGRRR